MARPIPQFTAANIGDAVAFLRSHGGVPRSQKPNYLLRRANYRYKTVQAGLPVSPQSERGHRITPEHPGRKRPALPAPASRYPGRKAVTTAPLRPGGMRSTPKPAKAPPAPPQRATGASVKRKRHDRAGEVTRGKTRVEFGHSIYGADLVPFTSEARALAHLQALAAENPHNRVMIDAHDCSKTRGARWTRIFANDGRVMDAANPWHNPGISVERLLEIVGEHGGSLEQALIAYAGTGKYPVRGTPINHVCIYNIYTFYRSDAQRKQDRKKRVQKLTQSKLL